MSSISQFRKGSLVKWVTGTTYQEGRLVWSPTDYQSYMRKTTGAGSTDPASDSTNWHPTGERAVKSIQRGIISIGATSTTATATITSVVTAKTELRYLGFSTLGTDNGFSARVVLTNTTTITATKTNASSVASTDVSWELTERY